jgi:hypothetical protein
MRRPAGWWCACAVAIASVATGQVPTAPVPMSEEPHHHLVFENDALRIFQPRISAGETTLEHLHSHDDLTVCISGSGMRSHGPGTDWSRVGQPCTPGQVSVTEYAGKPSSHTVQNAGTGVFQLVAIDNLRESGWSTNPALSAAATRLTKETRAFQVYEVRLEGNARETTHVHSRPTVVVLVLGEVTAGDKALRQPGAWALIPALEAHKLSTRGEARVVEVEVR